MPGRRLRRREACGADAAQASGSTAAVKDAGGELALTLQLLPLLLVRVLVSAKRL
jgi:hypothetical protein